MHPLDNVIWQALTTLQAQFAEVSGTARRFLPEVTLLSGFERPTPEGYASLSNLINPGGTAAVFLEEPYAPRAAWHFIAGAPLFQMVCEKGASLPAPPDSRVEILDLGLPDSPEMLELTALTKPGPFGPRTHELGAWDFGTRASWWRWPVSG